MYIREYMQTKVISISSNTLVPNVEKIMNDHNVRRLPVVDHGKLKGLVTQRDLLKFMPSPTSYSNKWEADYIIGNTLVRDIMVKARDLITVTPDTTIEDAVFLGQGNHVGTLPVIDKHIREKLIGIITMTALVKLVMQLFGYGNDGAQLHIFNCPRGWRQRNVFFIILLNNIPIQSMFQFTVPATGEEDTIIHLGTNNVTNLVDQLRARGYTVEVSYRKKRRERNQAKERGKVIRTHSLPTE